MSKSSHSTSELDTSIVIEPTLEGASLADLKREEEEARVEEETAIEKSRLAARELARQKGLKLANSALEVNFPTAYSTTRLMDAIVLTSPLALFK